MEQEMDTQELEYSISLDSLSESEEYYIQSFENVLETEELEYSVKSNSSDENDRSSESEMCESLQDLLLLKPYDFEPNIKDLPSDSNNQQKEKNENWRIGNTDWCICEKCQPMESEAESLCCLDTDEVPDDYFEGQKCVTSSEGFNTVCLSKIVLKTALSALNDLRGDSINYVNNCAYRYAGYKQFTWWVHNYLGKGVRKVTPSCAVWAIRTKYLSEDGRYIPFMESKEEEKRILEEI